jgi:Mor family transcriptional regulator
MWKGVYGFEDAYEISETGEVRRKKVIIPISDSMGRKYNRVYQGGNTLKHREHKFGYPVVTLSKDGVAYTKTIHRMMALTYLEHGFTDEECFNFVVRHKDGNPRNNVLENLEFGTQKDNIHDAMRHGHVQFGEGRYNAKLTNDIVKNIRIEKSKGAKNIALAEKYKLTDVYIHHLVTGRKWKNADGPITECRKANKLNKAERIAVLEMRDSGEFTSNISKKFKVSVTQIRNIIKEADTNESKEY